MLFQCKYQEQAYVVFSLFSLTFIKVFRIYQERIVKKPNRKRMINKPKILAYYLFDSVIVNYIVSANISK